MQESLFKPYVQGDSPARSEGSGLGLAICKQIVEAHGGTIGVTGPTGGGATFWFELSAFEPPQQSWKSLLEATQDTN
jgi:signal transduction histidine kinase